jgi:hypothetical protein
MLFLLQKTHRQADSQAAAPEAIQPAFRQKRIGLSMEIPVFYFSRAK